MGRICFMDISFDIVNKYKGEANYTFSIIITSIVAFVSSVVAAAYIFPEELGVIQAVLLVQTYASFLHFGVFNGINRNLAFYKAQGDVEKMQRQIDTSHTVSVVTAFVGLLIGIIVMILFYVQRKPSIYLWSGVCLTVFLVTMPLTNHLDNTFRSGQQFGLLGNIKTAQSVIYFVFSLLPIVLGYIGRILALIENMVFGYAARCHNSPYRHRGMGDLESFKELVATGAPLLLGGYIWEVFMASDKTYIAANLSARDLGLYTISGYCVTLLMVLPVALNTLLYPKVATLYGKTGDKRSLMIFWKKSLVLFSLVLLPLCAFVWLLLPYCVEWFMPNYVDGVPAARITLLTCLTFVASGPGVVFGTLRKNGWYIVAVAIALGLFWLIVTLFRDSFTTIERVAWLRLILSLILMTFVLIYSYVLIRR